MTRDQQNLPPWLRGVPLPPKPAGANRSTQPSNTSTPDVSSTATPDWMQGLAPARPATTDDTPSWLQGLGAESATAANTSADDIPDWLRDLNDIAPTPTRPEAVPPPPVAPAPERPRAAGFTSWLTNISDLPAEGPIEPIPIPPAPTPTRPAPAAPTRPAADVPSWLQPADEQSQPAEAAEALPDWLQSLSAEEDTPAESQAAPPAWLQESTPVAPAPRAPKPPTPITPPVVPTPMADDNDDIPSWLRSISDEELDRVAAMDTDTDIRPFALEGDTGPSVISEPQLPSWLNPEPQRQSGEATEWLGASASELIGAKNDHTKSDDDVPTWLRESEDGEKSDAPGWLRGPESPTTSASDPTLSSAATQQAAPIWGQESKPSAKAPSNTGGDIPAWLQESTPAPDDSGAELPGWLNPSAPTPTRPASGDAPAWLQESTPAPAANIPAWLQESEPELPAANAGPAGVPTWLQESEPELAIPPPAVVSSEPSAEKLPTWLRDTAQSAPSVPTGDALPPWLRDESGEPLPTAVAPGDANLPAWLRGTDLESLPVYVDTPTPGPEPVNAPPSSSPSSPNLDWFSGDIDTSTTPSQSNSMLGGADLPAWLRRETEKPRDTNPTDARSLDWIARLGAYDDDEISTPLEQPTTTRLTLPSVPVITPAQIEALELLRRMSADPLPAVQPLAQPAALSAFSRIGLERFISVLLLVLLIIAMVVPGSANLLPALPPKASVNTLQQQIDTLTEQDVVLVGYEWDAQRISELRPLEQAVIDQLIAKKVKVVLVSTDPQGTLLQFDLRDRLNAAGYQRGGVDYILLGYRPGGEIGLRALAQNLRGEFANNFQGKDSTQDALATNLSTSKPRLNTLNDFTMAIVFADEPSDVQGWMEQIRPTMQRPIAFMVPAGVEPIAQPYFAQPHVFHLAGTQEAEAMLLIHGGEAAANVATQAAQLRLAMLIFAGLLIFGSIGVLANTFIARRKRSM